MKSILRILGALLLLPVLLFVVAVAINQFDETLDPRAAIWGAPGAPSVPEAENGYYALLALGAPEDADAAQFARAWLDEARAAAKEKRTATALARPRPKRPPPCDPLERSCLDEVRANKAAHEATLLAYKTDMARYRLLIGAKRYEEVLDYPQSLYSAIPAYGDVTNAQRALLTQAALAAEAGDMDAAISVVERDIAYYRVMLSGSRTFLGKNYAQRRYWSSLSFMADLLKQKSAAMEPFAGRLQLLLAAIDPSALKLDAAMENEFATMRTSYSVPSELELQMASPSTPVFIAKLFYKPNTTVNQAIREMTRQMEVLRQPAGAIKVAFRQAMQEQADENPDWSVLNNPVGKRMTLGGFATYDNYALRLHDLDGFNRLVALRAEGLAAKITPAQVAEWPTRSEVRLHDPYTGKPMQWDAAKNRFQFTLQGKHSGLRFSVDAGRIFMVF